MKKSLIKKIVFILPPIVLALLTIIWYCWKDGRWYTYRNEWEFLPLFVCHLLMPLFYFVWIIIAAIRQINESTRSNDNIFYLVASIILWLSCGVGLFFFFIFTSGM
ncbi:hypothetical protein SAMN02910369_02776 [Lachnospiraceae bacterium NE2001]|nr:hypothetical protein SAMN02910369_02776 [Lachnospiraceae bacterium NE2001]